MRRSIIALALAMGIPTALVAAPADAAPVAMPIPTTLVAAVHADATATAGVAEVQTVQYYRRHYRRYHRRHHGRYYR